MNNIQMVNTVLSTRGLQCPLLIVKTKKIIEQRRKGETPKDADRTLTGNFFEVFTDMDIRLYVEEEALKERGFMKEDIPKADVISREKVSELLLETQTSIVF